jgi:hypothetical protein
VLVGLVLCGPKLLGSLSNGIAHEASRALSPATASKPAAGPKLSPAQAQQLDDWRIRAGLYAANDKPSTLPYVADANLASEVQQCRTQRSRLAALRDGLLKAPDRQLAASARRFDTATHDLLRACIANDPVALHHAEGAMTAAASDANARYNRLVGIDPAAYNATRVL